LEFFDHTRKSCHGSSCLGKTPSGKCSTSMAPIIIRNAIIKEEPMNYCCHVRGKRAGKPTPFALAKDWVAC
ncbi:MAG: hypothetical protein ACERKU_09210, partial [Nitrospirota bacterium]